MELDEVKVVFSSELENVESNADKLISTLEKLSSVVDSVSGSMQKATSSAEGFNSFLQSIEQSASASKEAVSSFSSMTQGIEQIGGVSKSASGDLDKIAESASALDEAGKKADSSGNQAAKAAVKWSALFAAVAKGAKIIMGFVENSANAIKEQTKFNFVFGQSEEQLKEAQKWTEEFADNLYLDVMQVRGLASGMKIMATNFGINNELANKMSKNLTKLAYDLSALSTTGDSAEQVMKKMEMGMAGQAKAMNTYGIMINQQALQNTLYANGINRTVSSLNSAERAYLTYYQIMKIASSQQGYFAKTVMSPANALNIIKTQFSLLAREIGNVFIPILMAAVPVIIMLTNALRTLARALAGFFGIDIDFDKYSSGVGSLSSGVSGIGKAADGASKKMKNMLRDFDELHVVDFGDDTGAGSGAGGGGGGIGFELPEIDYDSSTLKGLEEKFGKIKKILKDLLPYIIAIGIAFATWKIGSTIVDILKIFIPMTKKTAAGAMKIALGFAILVGSAYLIYDAFKKISEEGLNVKNVLELLIGTIGAFIASYIILSGLKDIGLYAKIFGDASMLKVAAGFALIIVGLIGMFVSLKNILTGTGDEATNLGIAFISLAAVVGGVLIVFGAIPALIVAIIGVITIAVVEIVRHWDTIKQKASEIFSKVVEVLSGIWNKVVEVVEKIWNKITTTFSVVAGWINANVIQPVLSVVVPIVTKIGEIIYTIWQIIVAVFSVVGNWVYQNVILPVIEYHIKLKNKIYEIVTTIWTFIKDIVSKIWNSITSVLGKLAGWVNQHVVQPIKNFFIKSFEVIGNIVVGIIKGAINGALQHVENIFNVFIAGLNAVVGIINQIPNVSIGYVTPLSLPRFAQGGFPDKGDLFIANEREPELIGSMGNRSVVANNAQITEGIAQASYNGMKRALQEVPISNKTDVYVGGKQLTDVITKQRRFNQVRFGN